MTFYENIVYVVFYFILFYFFKRRKTLRYFFFFSEKLYAIVKGIWRPTWTSFHPKLAGAYVVNTSCEIRFVQSKIRVENKIE